MSNITKPVSQNSTPSIASNSTALEAQSAGNRAGWMIQNLGQNPLFVRLGSSGSTTVFNVVLKAATANDDGTGGVYTEGDGCVWQGVVTIAGTSPRYVAWEYA